LEPEGVPPLKAAQLLGGVLETVGDGLGAGVGVGVAVGSADGDAEAAAAGVPPVVADHSGLAVGEQVAELVHGQRRERDQRG